MSKILLYLGTNEGDTLFQICKNFDFCYAFEANPEKIPLLKSKFKDIKNIEIIDKALHSEHNSQVSFFITENKKQSYQNKASSSLGKISDYYRNTGPKNPIFSVKEVTVNTVNLNTFLKERNIKEIDTYVSDLEGYDLTVLKTIKEFIDEKRIKNIQIETECDYFEGQGHDDLPSNKQKDIIDFLTPNYRVYKKQGDGTNHYNLDNPNRYFHQDLFLTRV